MTSQTAAKTDARRAADEIKGMLDDVIQRARRDIGEIDDPRAKALFETTAEVLIGLETAYQHYAQGTEQAWR
ncbi:MAG TPA: hypothetical protein VFU81_20755 [Thermomicrobiales bacterium]|nr:hypothetical protein [Thermomicrobiales bacterium]